MRETKFVCGACGQVSKKGVISRHHASWVPHESCGYETFFGNFVPGAKLSDPKPKMIRPIGMTEESGMPFDEFQANLAKGRVSVPFGSTSSHGSGLPSEDDLDADAEEKEITAATSKSPEADDIADAHKKIDETVTLGGKSTPDQEADAGDSDGDAPDPDAKRQEAIEYVMHREHVSKRQAKKLVAAQGVEKILADKAKSVAEKAQASA